MVPNNCLVPVVL